MTYVGGNPSSGNKPHHTKGEKTYLRRHKTESVKLKGSTALFVNDFALITAIVKPKGIKAFLWLFGLLDGL